MSPHSIPTLIGGSVVLFLGLFVFIKNRRSPINISFLLFSLSISFWLFGYTAAYSVKEEAIATFFCRLACVSAMFTAPTFYHLITNLLKIKGERGFVTLSYLAMVALTPLFLFSNYFLVGTYRYFWGNYSKAGPLHPLYLVIFFTIFSRVLFILFSKYREYEKSTPIEATRIKYLLIAILAGLLGAIDYLPKYGIAIYPFGFAFEILLAAIIAYTIIKYRLMDIEVVIRKGLVYSSLITLITLIYLLTILLLERIFQGVIGYKSLPLTIAAACVIAILFQPLKNKIQSFVDKYFFKGTREEVARENERLMEEIRRSERLRSVGTLAAGMAHEIKNPLSAIKTFAEYLPVKYEDKVFREKFNSIVTKEVDKINHIVSQLLDFSKPIPLTIKETDIHILIDETVNLLSNDLLKRKIELKRDYQAGDGVIKIDPLQLKQALLNMFLNAIDAINSDGVIHIQTYRENNKFFLRISDTGCGISKEKLSHIFDPFYSTKEKGTGLGLSVVHRIVKDHGGSIHAESHPGSGSTFLLKLRC
ncbi:MAG: GHKL domain-containing protein [Candidatus Omnitrophica bacterium]|nr:GHKL domain-containing protein [Candidatus Omnitrophota bacterium]